MASLSLDAKVEDLERELGVVALAKTEIEDRCKIK